MKRLSLLLWLIATAALAKEPAPAPTASTGITSELLAETGRMWDGTDLPAYPTGRPKISMVKFTIPPGSELPWHKHPSINAGYVVSGLLSVRTEDGKELILKAGDAIIELVDKWHAGRNDGSEPVVIVVFYAGTPGVPLAIRKDAASTPEK